MAYFVPPITSMVFLSLHKHDRLVKFHSIQSMLFAFVVFGLWTIVSFLKVLLIGFILAPVFWLGVFGIWMMVMYKAYNNELYELPIIGTIAREHSEK